MTEAKPRFAIMGSGGVGGYFGACLAQAGFDTWFVARGAHLEAMQTGGLRIEGPDETVAVQAVKATDNPAEIGPVDFVLFSVKLWDTAEAGAACRPMLGEQTGVVSLQIGTQIIQHHGACTKARAYELIDLQTQLLLHLSYSKSTFCRP